MIRMLPQAGKAVWAPAAITFAQADHPSEVAGARDTRRVKSDITPLSSGLHEPAAPGAHVVDWDMRRHFGEGMMRGMYQEAINGFGMEPPAEGRYDECAGSRLAPSDVQRARTKQIIQTVCKEHWELRGRMMQEQSRLRDLLNERTPDPKIVGSTYCALYKLNQQMLETHLQARNEIYQLLSPEQRKEADRQRQCGQNLGWESQGYRRGITPR